ncbi:MAG TPA: hypothetical protein VFR17_07100 [Mycobacterium sp.]|nr:hypothetical protein [Mycobacterium sp.]
MTGSRPDTRDQPTRPISVAELLAKNGTIGSPPVTGRRRRRRGNSGAVTVAELTGEIPVIRIDDEPEQDEPAPDEQGAAVDVDVAEPVPASPAETLAELRPEPEPDAAVDDKRRIGWSEPGPRWPKSPSPTRSGKGPEHSPDPRPARRSSWVEPDQPAMFPVVELEPEELAIADAAGAYPGVQPGFDPSPADDVDSAEAAQVVETAGVTEAAEVTEAGEVVEAGEVTEAAEVAEVAAPTSSRPRWTLTNPRKQPAEQEVEEPADDVVAPKATAEPDDGGESGEPVSRRSELVGGLAVVLQSIMAVAFGAGLFVGFDQLWRWNSIVALVLAMLVTLGLAAAVRLVRKTDDIGSTLTAVAVGLLVTLGPLALHAG